MNLDDNNILLFKNPDKTKDPADKRPDYKGEGKVNGADIQVAGWIRTAKKSGEKFMSIKVEPKGARQRDEVPATATVPPDDDIPF